MQSKSNMRNEILKISFFSIFMIYYWINTELWSRSFWINETDTLSFAKYGIEGFGYGYSPLIYIYHLILEIFGPNDLIFRITSLLFSLVTLVLIYKTAKYIDNTEYTSYFSCIIFILSSYSIDHGLQIRSYAFNTMFVTLIFFWCVRIFRDDDFIINKKEKIFILLISSSIWAPSSHYFAIFYLFTLFSFLILIFHKKIELNKKLFFNPLFPPISTFILFSGLRALEIVNALINSSKGEHYSGVGGSGIITINIINFLDVISSQSVVVSIMIIFGLFSATHYSIINNDKYEGKLLKLILIIILLPITICLSLQYVLSGIYALRYLYFWYPLICIISGFGFSYFIRNLSQKIKIYKKERLEIILGLIFLLTIILTVKSEPVVNYGAMDEAVEFVNEYTKEEEEIAIISSPPEHILEYYLMKHEINKSISVGSWDPQEFDIEKLDLIDSDVVVIFGIQPAYHWIFNYTESWLIENNFWCNPDEFFEIKGDKVRICRR